MSCKFSQAKMSTADHQESRDGTMVRVLTSQQSGSGSIAGLSIMRVEFVVTIVSVLAPRVFSGFSSFSPSTKTQLLNSNLSQNARMPLNQVSHWRVLNGGPWENSHYTSHYTSISLIYWLNVIGAHWELISTIIVIIINVLLPLIRQGHWICFFKFWLFGCWYA